MIGKTLLRWLISLFAVIAILIIILLTPLGLKIGLHVADLILPGKISYEHSSGIITGPIELTHFKYVDGKSSLSIQKLKLSWSPFELLRHKVVITKLRVNNVHLTLDLKKSKQNQPKKEKKKTASKPYLLEIENARINSLSIGSAPNQYPVFIRHIQLKAQVDPNKVIIRSSISMTKPFPLSTSFNVTGNLDRYTLYVRAQSPKVSWHLFGIGNSNGLSLNLREGKTLGGNLSFNADVNWAPQWQWDVKLNGSHLNFKALDANWPSQLNVKLTTKGSLENNKPQFTLSTQITSPGASIHLSAAQQDKLNLKWNFNIAQLSNLYAPYKGSIQSQGEWKANGFFSFKVNGKNLHIPATQLTALSLQGHGTEPSHDIQGQVSLNSNTIHFHVQGGLSNETWQGQLKQLTLTSSQYHNWQLIQPTHLTISKERISTHRLCLRSVGNVGQLCANGNWNAKTAWQFKITGKAFNPALLTRFISTKLTLSSPASLSASLSGKGDQLLSASVNLLLSKGKIRYQYSGNYIASPLQRGNINLTLRQHTLTTSVQLSLSKSNSIALSATMPNFFLEKSFDTQRIKGKIKITIADLTPFNKAFIAVAKPSGTVAINLNISGKLKSPDVRGTIDFKNGTVEIPKLGIVLTKINTHIASFSAGLIKYKITAYSKKQPITIEGQTKATPQGIKSTLYIKAKNTMIMNTPEYIIYATPDFKVTVLGNNIDLTGKVDIPQGLIQPVEVTSVTSLPTDQIVYTAGEPISKKTTWNISADLQVTLGKAVTVNTSGFHATITGQTTIVGRPKKTTLANGRINIIKGKYTAYGKTLRISSGSYIQFINSPIDNPNFNIRATKTIQQTQSSSQQFSVNNIIVGVELRGSFRRPKISFFSIPANLSQADIISYLVLGYSAENTSSANLGLLLEAASSLGGGKGGGIGGAVSEIKQGLGLTELGVESETLVSAIGSPIDQQTAFVIGKALTKNIYIRYSLGLGQGPFAPVNIFQVRYTLSSHWAIQSNSSNLGNGGDILYTIETN